MQGSPLMLLFSQGFALSGVNFVSGGGKPLLNRRFVCLQVRD